MSTSKIKSKHLALDACVYLRQSSPEQVEKNTGSTERQYDLRERAIVLGWPPSRVRVIDEDLGLSGKTADGRSGFEKLVMSVSLKEVGAVLCREVSRLARGSYEWQHLLRLCVLTDTLIIDDDSVYDPKNFNDSLVLNIKGIMSEAEWHYLRQRNIGGRNQKAQKGEYRKRLPTGLIYTREHAVIFDPSPGVQETIHLFFQKFDEFASARHVVAYFNRQQRLFPSRHYHGANRGRLVWVPLTYTRTYSMLHNPAYAGVYRYEAKAQVDSIYPEDLITEPILIHDAYPAYISWETFLRNEQQLADNCLRPTGEGRGAPREGNALLQGIAVCGTCGHGLRVDYQRNGNPSYRCTQRNHQYGAPYCQSVVGTEIDKQVARRFLEAIQPAQIAAAVEARNQMEAQQTDATLHWKRRLHHAKQAADLAHKRYLAVDPENREVAAILERDWNIKLQEMNRLHQSYEAYRNKILKPLHNSEIERVEALVQDLPQLWAATTTTNTRRKQLLRLLIDTVTILKREKDVYVAICWQTGAVMELSVPLPKNATELFKTDSAVIERIRALSRDHTDVKIAEILNAEDFIPAKSAAFSSNIVGNLRRTYNISRNCPSKSRAFVDTPRGDGRYSTYAAARLLGVSHHMVWSWCRAGKLDYVRDTPRSPYWISLTPEDFEQASLARSYTAKTKYKTNGQ